MNFTLRSVARRALPQRLWHWLQRARHRAQLLTFARRWVQRRHGGIELQIYISDPVAEQWYDRDVGQLEEIAFLTRHALRPGATVFDIGAHQGVVALILAHEVGPSGTVVALEASVRNCRIARRNARRNRAPQILVRHAAVAEASGSLLFSESFAGRVLDPSNPWGLVRTPAVTVDDLAREYGDPDVLFMDVEGYEAKALRGAVQTLQRRPDCLVEVHVRDLQLYGDAVADVLLSFPVHAYALYAANETERTFRPLAEVPHVMRDRFFLIAQARRDGAAD